MFISLFYAPPKAVPEVRRRGLRQTRENEQKETEKKFEVEANGVGREKTNVCQQFTSSNSMKKAKKKVEKSVDVFLASFSILFEKILRDETVDFCRELLPRKQAQGGE